MTDAERTLRRIEKLLVRIADKIAPKEKKPPVRVEPPALPSQLTHD
jgi:hypothetical protein